MYYTDVSGVFPSQALYKTGKWSGHCPCRSRRWMFSNACSLVLLLGVQSWWSGLNMLQPWQRRHHLGPHMSGIFWVHFKQTMLQQWIEVKSFATKITWDIETLELKSHDFYSDLVPKEKFTTQPWAAKLRDGPGLMALGAQTAGGLRFSFIQTPEKLRKWREVWPVAKENMVNLWNWKEDKETVMAQKCESPKIDLDIFDFKTWSNLRYFSTFHQPHLFGLTFDSSHLTFPTHTRCCATPSNILPLVERH